MTTHPRKPAQRQRGYTIAELLVAMTVSAIVLGAVATLAFATGKADTAFEDLLTAETVSRFDTRRISDALRYSRALFQTPNGNIALWRADDNGDNRINGSELLFLRKAGSDLRLYRFGYSTEITVGEIENDTAYNELLSIASANDEVIKSTLMRLPDKYNPDVCTDAGLKMVFSNVLFTFPDMSKTNYVNLSYDLTVKRIDKSGQVTSQTTTRHNLPVRLLSSADNLLDPGTGEIVSSDDD